MLQATTKWELLVHSAPLLSQRQRHLFRTTPPLTRPLPTRLQPTKHQPTKLQPTRFTLPLIDDWLPKSRFQAPASAFQIPVNRVTGQPVQWPRRPKIFQIFCHSIPFNNFSQDNQWLQRTTRQRPTLLWLRPPALPWRDSPSRSVLDRSRSCARCNLKHSLF